MLYMRDIFRTLQVRVRDPFEGHGFSVNISLLNIRTFHYMEFPSAGRRLQANFSGVIGFDFSIDVVANTVFGSHETKKLIRT